MTDIHLPKLVIHGGAGSLEGDIDKRIAFHEALTLIVNETYTILCDHDARKAVLHAVRQLEDDPIFNAGTGSRLQQDGKIRMSASIMDGKKNQFSSVINIENVKHPIDVADLLAREKNTILAGELATKYARQHGFGFYDPITETRRQEYERHLLGKSGTVGAVALDSRGNIVAGTSTGGIGGEIPGRVSDSGTVAGNYASAFVGVSCTGVGEHIVNYAAAVKVVNRVDDGMSLNQAVSKTIVEAETLKYKFGLIALDKLGNIEVAKTTNEIFYASHDGEKIETFIK